ncbi:hypothetical protein QFC21_005719 [Naganishia friedmannii]|uniref:Uncharacterized protein n=1 Tax=Naganishia friedmannii TaxID=89922 RepID=A0ACC2V6M5_9TREE|nr:hypothetical protein QFC21_005719 [Naganishia friedmannii]
MGAGLLSAIIPSAETKATAPSDKAIEKGSWINQKAYTFIYAHLHDDVLGELSPEVSDPARSKAKALWDELKARYGGGAMHELVSTIDVILSTRIHEGEDPRDKLNGTRSAFFKFNGSNVPLDDKFFALLVLKKKPLRESRSANIQPTESIIRQPPLEITES